MVDKNKENGEKENIYNDQCWSECLAKYYYKYLLCCLYCNYNEQALATVSVRDCIERSWHDQFWGTRLVCPNTL